jgi:hypothetical protein
MKKTLTILAVLASASAAYAQGTINFFSANQVFMPGGTVGVGAGYTAGLFLASDRNNPLPGGTTTFLTAGGEGYLSAVEATVPGFATGSSTAQYVVRVWQTGQTYATSPINGESAVFTTGSLGGPVPNNPPALPPDANFASFTLVPEPSTYALGALGLGALAMMRRRK